VDRARLRLPDFEMTEKNAGAVARVCRKLDGIPLAIEIATARMGALAVEQVAQRLDVLKGASRTAAARQRTLRATLDWSHDLLSEAERVLFRSISAFAGLTTARDAEGGGMGHIPETLINLGLASLQLGSYKQADATFKEALIMAREVGIRPEIRHQIPRRPQGRHGPDQRPGRVLDHSEGRSSAGGPRGLRAHRRAGAHRGVDRRPGVRDQQGGQPGGGSEAVGL
jgi:hypothetical protein